MWQTCDECKREIHFEWSAEDWVWETLPKSERKKVMCIECFLEKINKPKNKFITNSWNINDFKFISIVTQNFSTILWDKD